MSKVVLVFIICFQGFFSKAAECTTPKRVLFYANGMFNSFESTEELLEELKSDFHSKYPQTVFDKHEIAYNTNEFVLMQMFEVYKKYLEDGYRVVTVASFVYTGGDYYSFDVCHRRA